MRIIVGILTALALAVGLNLSTAEPAQAAWEDPIPNRVVCVEDRTNGSSVYRVGQAEHGWDSATDLLIYRYGIRGCSSSKWKVKVRVSAVTSTRMKQIDQQLNVNHCGNAAACTWRVWYSDGSVQVEIALNGDYIKTLPDWRDRQHIISHEFGHAWGLHWHSTSAWSVMRTAYPPNSPYNPSWRDIAWINERF